MKIVGIFLIVIGVIGALLGYEMLKNEMFEGFTIIALLGAFTAFLSGIGFIVCNMVIERKQL